MENSFILRNLKKRMVTENKLTKKEMDYIRKVLEMTLEEIDISEDIPELRAEEQKVIKNLMHGVIELSDLDNIIKPSLEGACSVEIAEDEWEIVKSIKEKLDLKFKMPEKEDCGSIGFLSQKSAKLCFDKLKRKKMKRGKW